MPSIEQRKRILKKIALNEDLTNGALIYNLIHNNILDHLILKINDVKTKTNSSAIVKKSYLTGEEQFIELLNSFIMIYNQDFCYIGKNKKIILEIILRYPKKNLFLLCKHYWGDNDFISYFQYNIKRYIVIGFFSNLKYLYNKCPLIDKMLVQENLKIKNMSLNHTEDVNKLYELLILLASCNGKEFNITYLFDDINVAINDVEARYHYGIEKSMDATLQHYIMQWERLIENYFYKKDCIKTIV